MKYRLRCAPDLEYVNDNASRFVVPSTFISGLEPPKSQALKEMEKKGKLAAKEALIVCSSTGFHTSHTLYHPPVFRIKREQETEDSQSMLHWLFRFPALDACPLQEILYTSLSLRTVDILNKTKDKTYVVGDKRVVRGGTLPVSARLPTGQPDPTAHVYVKEEVQVAAELQRVLLELSQVQRMIREMVWTQVHLLGKEADVNAHAYSMQDLHHGEHEDFRSGSTNSKLVLIGSLVDSSWVQQIALNGWEKGTITTPEEMRKTAIKKLLETGPGKGKPPATAWQQQQQQPNVAPVLTKEELDYYTTHR